MLAETRNVLEPEPAISLTPWKTASALPNGSISVTPGTATGKDKEQHFFGSSFTLEIPSQVSAVRGSSTGTLCEVFDLDGGVEKHGSCYSQQPTITALASSTYFFIGELGILRLTVIFLL
jgi:hypothetical protein